MRLLTNLYYFKNCILLLVMIFNNIFTNVILFKNQTYKFSYLD